METKLNMKSEYVNIPKKETSEIKESPLQSRRRFIDRSQTRQKYLNIEDVDKSNKFYNESNRNVDSQSLMLQVRLNNDDKLETDLEDANTVEYVNQYIDSRHPRKKLDNGEYVPFPVCRTDTGLLGCGSFSKSELNPLGLGMVIYFKILKVYSIIFFCLVLINIPLYYIYTSNHPEFKITSHKDALFKTTIGNIASTLYNCQKIPVSDIYKSDKYTFNLDCDSYNISSIYAFGLSSDIEYTSESFSTCQNFTNYLNITTDDNCSFESDLNKYAASNCVDMTSCTFTVDMTGIQKSCLSSVKYDYFFFSYSCYDNWVLVGESKVDRSAIAWIIVCLDVGSMICLFISMIVIPIALERTAKYFKENVVEISDYTIHFKNLNLDNNIIYKELDEFIAHLYKIHQHENQFLLEEEDFIYDINYPIFSDEKLKYLNEKVNLTCEIEKKERKLMEAPDENLIQEITSMKSREEALIKRIREIHYTTIPKINDIYVTFTKQSFRNKIFKAYKSRGRCARCCTICCLRFHTIKQYYFRHKWVEIEEATDQPSNIRWQNIPYPKFKKYFRKFLVYLIAILILAASFGIVIGAKYAQESIDKEFNTSIDCSFVKYTEESVLKEFTDATISNKDKYLTYCYCRDNLISSGFDATQNIALGDGVTPCNTWINLYLKSQSLMIGTVILVPLVNIILSAILSILTEMERNDSVSVNTTSSMIKSFLLQLINTAIIILIVNIAIPEVKTSVPDFPLFTGQFSDFSPGWYYQVGATFLFYMLLNIVTPHSNALISYLITLCKRLLDRKLCNFKKRHTKKKTRKEYIDLYTGPQFNIGMRYSQILTTIFAVLLYSSGIPLLYLCCFLFFLLTYWIDKWLVLRLYRNPPHIDLYVSKLFNIIIFVAIIIHCGIGIWIYGNEVILSDNTSSGLEIIADWIKNQFNLLNNSFGADILTRISYSYNILIILFLAIVLIVFLIKVLHLDYILFACCKFLDPDLQKVKDVNIYDAIELRGLYINHQIRKAQYFVLTDTKINFQNLTKIYFDKMLDLDRYHIARRLKDITKHNIDPEDKNFDDILARIMKNETISDKSLIQAEYSYNITFVPEFQIVVKYELFDKYSIENEKNNDEEEEPINKVI